MSDSTLVQSQLPCDSCGSSDAVALYDDGHTYCFSCGEAVQGEGQVDSSSSERPAPSELLTNLKFEDLVKRGISAKTCRKWGYGKTKQDGRTVQVATYRDEDGTPVAQKIRTAKKDFSILGDAKAMGLFGAHLWRKGGKRIIVTEGEIDALSVSQVQDHQWPVVSIPNGAQSAAKAFKKNLEYLESFDAVVIMFDQDEPGRKAAKECAEVLSPGKGHIAVLDAKDPNELLQKKRSKEIIKAQWDAKAYRPDGIIDGKEALRLLESRELSTPIAEYPIVGLQNATRGVLGRQVVVVCSGSGMGKTEFVREIGYSFIQQGLKLGYVALEESVDRTAVGLIGCHMSKRLYLEDRPQDVEGFAAAWEEVITDKVFFYDHFGSMDMDVLISKLRYLRVACGVDAIILDHLSIVVSGLEDGDERRTIDNVMTAIRSLSEETGVAILVVSHLKRPQGTPHEEGGKTSLAQLRGSAAIGQLADIAIGLERDQQDQALKDFTTVRILKNRRTGQTGVVGHMHYDHETGRMTECPAPEKGSDFSPEIDTDY